MKILEINPMAKPRMTIGDRAGHRPIVKRYWQYKQDLQILAACTNLFISDQLTVIFYIKMPASWSEKKKREMFMKPHTQRPDLDNLIKGLQDCLLVEDAHIWHYKDCRKLWAYEGRIEIGD